MSRWARLTREAHQAPFSSGSPVSFQAHCRDPSWTWLAWRPWRTNVAGGAGSSLGSHGTRLTLRARPAAATRGTWLATVTLRSWEARVSSFPLETRGSHESRGASGTRVPPQAGFAILPV